MSEWLDFYDPLGMNRDSPVYHERIVIWRENWPEPKIVAYSELSPLMNVIGLKWKPLPHERRDAASPNGS